MKIPDILNRNLLNNTEKVKLITEEFLLTKNIKMDNINKLTLIIMKTEDLNNFVFFDLGYNTVMEYNLMDLFLNLNGMFIGEKCNTFMKFDDCLKNTKISDLFQIFDKKLSLKILEKDISMKINFFNGDQIRTYETSLSSMDLNVNFDEIVKRNWWGDVYE